MPPRGSLSVSPESPTRDRSASGSTERYLDSPSPENTRPASGETEDNFTKSCRQKGRWINIAICFGIEIHDLFKFGIRNDQRNLGGDSNSDLDDDDDLRNLTPKQMDFLITAYKAILGLIPKLRKILPIRGDDPDAVEYFFKVMNAMQGGCSMARSESIRRIKQNMVVYLGAGRNPVKIDTQIKDKSMRGLNHPQIGRLLIPAEHLLDWDEDTDATRDAFNTGVLQIRGVDMPTFLYKDYKYNPDDPEEGLFQGPFLVCVLIDILFGSNAVDTKNVRRDEECRHHCVGEMYESSTISPQNIAYAAVIARFSLSSKRSWHPKDDFFNYHHFYHTIVTNLSDCEDPWVRDTLRWWNERVFGDERGKVTTRDMVEEDHKKQRNFAQRQAQRKAADKLKAAAEARRQGMASDEDEAPLGEDDAEPRDTDAMPANDSGSNTTSTPRSQPNPDKSAPVPRTPDAPGPSTQRSSSPLSNMSDMLNPGGTQQIASLKRKRQASKADRPKTRTASKAKRKTTQA